MKTNTMLALIAFAALCSACTPKKPTRESLVPTVESLVVSPEWRLAHTMKSGIALYVRALDADTKSALSNPSHPDRSFLQEDADGQPLYLLVPIKDGKITELKSPEDIGEGVAFIMRTVNGLK